MSGAHHHGHSHSLAERGSLNARAAMASVAMALTLIALKVWASWETGSVAMLGSLADTTLDFVASLSTLIAVRYAAQPADDDHRFGHGKAEALAALFQVMLITMSALAIAWRAAERWGSNTPTEGFEAGVAVSVIAMVLTGALLAYQHWTIRRTKSVAIQADHVHYQSDLLLNIGVIIALALDHFWGLRGADPILGMLIAVWLLWGAWSAGRNAIDQLMDREWDDEKRARFLAVAKAHPELAGIHDLRTRTSGGHDFAQFHIWVRPDMTVLEAHDVMDRIEEMLMAEFPGTEILIHPDPVGHTDTLGYIPSETVEHQHDSHPHPAV